MSYLTIHQNQRDQGNCKKDRCTVGGSKDLEKRKMEEDIKREDYKEHTR